MNDKASAVFTIVRSWINTTARGVRHFSWAILDQAVISGSNFVSSVLLARILGPNEFGRYVLAWTALLLIQGLQHGAINGPMMSIGPKEEESKAPRYYGAVFVQQAIFVTTATVLSWFGIVALTLTRPSWEIGGFALPLCATILVCLTHDFLRRYFYSLGRPHLSLIMDTARYLGQICILTAYFAAGWPANGITALWVMVVTSLVATITLAPFISRLEWSHLQFKAIVVRNWHFAKWMTASALLSWATNNLYVMVSGALLGAATVGGLRAAQNIVGVTHLLFLGLENVVPVEAARRLVRRRPSAVSTYLQKVAIAGGAATALICCIFVLFPDFWLGLLFGDSYRSYGYLVRWWALVEVLTFFSLPLNAWLRTFEKTRAGFYAYLFAAAVSIILIYPFVRYLGASGAMLGMVISVVTQLVVLMTVIKRM
jgi:O-antigen/teichoic acid export membrane protein